MADTTIYYALTLTASGTTSSAYYSLTPTSNLTMSQGGVTITPTATATAMVNVYPETLQIQSPAGMLSAAVTIVTGDSQIAGRLLVSPPVNVAVVVTLYGAGGQQLGQAILDPGVGSKAFSFPISADQGIQSGDIGGIVRGLVPPATP
jgi:hypothetical protein